MLLLKLKSIENQKTACILIGLFSDQPLSEEATLIDTQVNNQLQQCLTRGDINDKVGQTLILPQSNAPFERILVVSCGKKNDFSARKFIKVTEQALATLVSLNCRDAITCLPNLLVPKKNRDWIVRITLQLTSHACYRFDQFKSKNKTTVALKKLYLFANNTAEAKQWRVLAKENEALDKGMTLHKNLANTPGNVCTPTYLATQAKALAKQYPSLKVTVLDEAEMKKLGMNALLAISQGSKTTRQINYTRI